MGRSHLLAAKPKIGKTSLIFHLVQEWYEKYGDACPEILWISEEAEEVWGMRRASLRAPDVPVNILFHHESNDWFKSVLWRPEEVIIVDTVSAVLGLVDENSNNEVGRVLRVWTDLCRVRDKTVIFVHHLRKSSGDFGDAVAGAGAFLRVPDVVIELTEVDSLRYLTARGRYPSPGSIYYDSEFRVTEKKKVDSHSVPCESCGTMFKPLVDSHVLCFHCFRGFR